VTAFNRDLAARVAELGIPLTADIADREPHTLAERTAYFLRLEADVRQIVARQRAQAAVEKSAAKLRRLLAHPDEAPHIPGTPGELAEYRHLKHDADPDSTTPAFPDLSKGKPWRAS
jgi:hypothetical protein